MFATRRGGAYWSEIVYDFVGYIRERFRGAIGEKTIRQRGQRTVGGQSGEGGGEIQGECDHRRGAPEVPHSTFLNPGYAAGCRSSDRRRRG